MGPPFVGVAVNVTDVPAQIVVAVAPILTLTGKLGLTVIVMLLLVAVVGAAQVALDIRTTVTTSPLARVAEVKVLLFIPAFTPFTFHWYDGVAPPFVGVAVKVTEVPEHIVLPGFAIILTEGTKTGFTVIVILLLVAGLPVAHGAALEVNITFTISPFASVAELKVALFVPAFTPFACH